MHSPGPVGGSSGRWHHRRPDGSRLPVFSTEPLPSSTTVGQQDRHAGGTTHPDRWSLPRPGTAPGRACSVATGDLEVHTHGVIAVILGGP